MTLGREIKKARIDKGWQQQDLKEATGLSQKYLSAVELDKVQPSFAVVHVIAHALGVSLDELAKGVPPTRPARRQRITVSPEQSQGGADTGLPPKKRTTQAAHSTRKGTSVG